MTAPIRVIIADDQEIVRAGFAALLDTQPDIVGRRRQRATATTRIEVVAERTGPTSS